jgi:hypothetical protein
MRRGRRGGAQRAAVEADGQGRRSFCMGREAG